MRLKPQDRVICLNLYATINRAVTDVEKPMIFRRPVTEGRFLSKKLWVISVAGTSWMDEQRALAKQLSSARTRGGQNISARPCTDTCPRAASTMTLRARDESQQLYIRLLVHGEEATKLTFDWGS